MALVTTYIIILFSIVYVSADEIDIQMRSGNVMKFLRAMNNQTSADSLNLPANASSIRENISDTFSCENRTYGYYADVDNECQIFHVCLPSQTPSGRNVTYRWSFICPNETIFNQEVLVCTRPRDAIPCEESPMFYDINMEIGRIPEDNEEGNENKQTNTEASKRIKVKKNPNKRPVIRKQNLEVQNLLQEVVDEEMTKVDDQLEDAGVDGLTDEIVPMVVDVEMIPDVDGAEVDTSETEDRIVEERRLWSGRKLRRGAFRFKADV